MVRRALSLLVLLGLLGGAGGAGGAEPGLPANVHLSIHDRDERPVSGVKVTVSRPEAADGDAGISGETDKEGHVTLTVPMPAIQGYMVAMEIEKAGYPKFKMTEFLFDDAHKDIDCLISDTRKTTIHVRGADGQAIEGASLQFRPLATNTMGRTDRRILTKENYSSGNPSIGAAPTTDVHGDVVWEHSPVPQGFQVTVGPAEKPVTTIESKDVDEVTVTLAKGSFEKLIPTRVLEGKLLLPNGKPATDWFAGGRVTLKSAGGFSGGIVQMTQNYAADHMAHPGADGRFVIRAPGPFLGLISPEGIQFLYGLNPELWDPTVHHVGFTVPSVTGGIQLRLVDIDGKSLAGVPFRPTWMRSGSFWWQLSDDSTWGGGTAGNPDWKMVSDEKGMIDYPIYHGAYPINFQIGMAYDRPGDRSQYVGTGDLGVKTEIIVRTPTGGSARPAAAPRAEPAQATATPEKPALHHLTLAFVDPEGEVVTDFREIHLKAAGNPSDHGRSSYADSAGLHYFLPSEERQLELEIPVGVYKPLHQSIVLDDNVRQTLKVHVERGLPVKGRVLNADGKPAADVALSIYTLGVPVNPGTSGINALDIRAVTDAEGRFEIASAPDECFAAMTHTMERLKITVSERTFEVHLPGYGSMRALLPEGLEIPAQMNFVEMISSDPTAKYTAEMRLDLATHTLFRDDVPVGRYHLAPAAIPGMGDISGLDVEVTAGAAAILDLRRQPMEKGAAAPVRTVVVAVERDKKPISGVEVAVFGDLYSQEEIQARIDAYVKAKDAAGKTRALNKVREAGETARELLPPPSTNPAALSAVDDLRHSLGTVTDGLELLASDLSDDGGMVQVQARAGRVCWAVARVRGQWLGMKQFTVPDGDTAMPTVSVTLEGLRPVIAPVPGRNSNPPMTYSFTVLKPEGIERRLLLRALTDDHLWGAGAWGGGSMRSNLGFAVHPDGFTFDGIPPGTVISLQPPQAPGTNYQPTPVSITIESGTGPMQLKVQ